MFGHTHEIVDGHATGTAYFNPGTWQPHLDLRYERGRAALERGVTLELRNDESLDVTDLLATEVTPDIDDHRPAHVALVRVGDSMGATSRWARRVDRRAHGRASD